MRSMTYTVRSTTRFRHAEHDLHIRGRKLQDLDVILWRRSATPSGEGRRRDSHLVTPAG